jgi:D-alanyl-D-alanine carboxypeptidase
MQSVCVETGLLDDVSALAGEVGRSDRTIAAFVVLIDGPFCARERAWQVQEAIVVRWRR